MSIAMVAEVVLRHEQVKQMQLDCVDHSCQDFEDHLEGQPKVHQLAVRKVVIPHGDEAAMLQVQVLDRTKTKAVLEVEVEQT